MSVAQRIRWTARGLRHVMLRQPASWKFVPRWLQTVWSSDSPLQRRHPWVTYPALSWLDQNVTPDMRVFEFGSGGSTLYFAERAAEVFSVEHDPEWHAAVCAALAADDLRNCRLQLIEATSAQPGKPDLYAAERKPVIGRRFEAYARAIDAHPDASFDLVIVDGWARLACIQHALPKIKPGGHLLLDNSEWPEFQSAHEHLRACTSQRFAGLGPFGAQPWETTVWRMDQSQSLPAAA
ncbi:MAG: class I SAM-dependent methyltransferase [Planctomycetaceae bacterium]|nr:class I SAM-dependent methyltransferase [Planctomycetaceae bacterium]